MVFIFYYCQYCCSDHVYPSNNYVPMYQDTWASEVRVPSIVIINVRYLSVISRFLFAVVIKNSAAGKFEQFRF